MLSDIYNNYKQSADFIPDWQNINKNTLCNLYVQHENELIGQSYLAALILQYWPKIHRLYKKSYPYATYEQVYEWLEEAILTTITRKDWLNPSYAIYNDPAGPDKCINRTIMTIRANYFQALNRDKRKIIFNTLSYDTLRETCDEIDFIFTDNTMQLIPSNISSVDKEIKKFFDKKDYLKAFMLDILSFNNDDNLNLSKEIHTLDDIYANYFSDRYGYSIDQVKKAISYEVALSKKTLEDKINNNLLEMKHLWKENNVSRDLRS